MTYCLEGSCSIQLSYETYIFFKESSTSELDLYFFSTDTLCLKENHFVSSLSICIQTRLAGFESTWLLVDRSTWLTGVSQLDRPVTYCLEGSCSIQLSYETYIFFSTDTFCLKENHFCFEPIYLHSDEISWIRIYLATCRQVYLANWVSQLDRRTVRGVLSGWTFFHSFAGLALVS
ncbi:MAG: hypothetical protein IPJ54_17055 [Saprospiraceae bacterium]|nr:hypothetical protein [Saprospiraceae bacterium]